MEPIIKSALTGVLVGNDCWLIHLYAKGDKFDDLHNLAESYYDKLKYQSDYLMELAAELGVPIVNTSEAMRYLPNYTIENGTEYTWEMSMDLFRHKLGEYVSSLKELRASIDRPDIQSWLDDIMRHWEKELNYRLVRRGTNNATILNGFVNTGLDNALAYKMTS